MKRLDTNEWNDLERGLQALAALGVEGGAQIATLAATGEGLVLNAAFPEPHKSPLQIDIDRKSQTVCASFGRGIQVSDYALDVPWLLALARRVSNGEWRERCVYFGSNLYSSRATLLVGEREETFSGTDIWTIRPQRPRRLEVAYTPWNVINTPPP
ncbi:MAG TPA: hypothetical protein VFN67_13250 [Polyangiales bacterium]|nr:hypothetical protein [Polyangiales bacterium]